MVTVEASSCGPPWKLSQAPRRGATPESHYSEGAPRRFRSRRFEAQLRWQPVVDLRAGEFRDRLLSRATQARLTVAASEIDQLEAYYHLLSRWNRTINLTALSLEPLCDDTVDRLLIEPLAVAFHVPDSRAGWFDLGSGGGSPAIPLKIVRPLLGLTMVEARARKAAFLREVIRDLALPD